MKVLMSATYYYHVKVLEDVESVPQALQLMREIDERQWLVLVPKKSCRTGVPNQRLPESVAAVLEHITWGHRGDTGNCDAEN